MHAQVPVNTSGFSSANGVSVNSKDNKLTVTWPTGAAEKGQLIINLENDKPLFSSIQLVKGLLVSRIVKDADPAFLLTVGKRDLISQNGWNIFFDKVPLKTHQSYLVKLEQEHGRASVRQQQEQLLKLMKLKRPVLQVP